MLRVTNPPDHSILVVTAALGNHRVRLTAVTVDDGSSGHPVDIAASYHGVYGGATTRGPGSPAESPHRPLLAAAGTCAEAAS
jgi:hypothetical protein